MELGCVILVKFLDGLDSNIFSWMLGVVLEGDWEFNMV